MCTSRLSTRIWTPPRPLQYPAVFINTYTGVCQAAGQDFLSGGGMISFNAWGYVDLKKLTFPDIDISAANAVRLVGELIISDGNTSMIPDLAVSFKAPDDDISATDSYVWQGIGVGTQGGTRTPMSATVNLVNGAFRFAMLCGDSGKGQFPTNAGASAYPDDASYGVNLVVAEVLLP